MAGVPLNCIFAGFCRPLIPKKTKYRTVIALATWRAEGGFGKLGKDMAMEGTVLRPSGDRLKPWERRGLIALLLVMLAFGAVVEWRSAFLKRRMTDLGAFLRAAWAVRVGGDFYSTEDENHWHFHYPPVVALLLTPLADPPPGANRAGMLPFGVSVLIWYGLSLVFLVLAVHWLAGALEQSSAHAAVRAVPPGSRRWWALRALPVVVCLPILGASLVRGQVDALMLMLLCGMIAAALRGRSGRAGLWLAAAICLKIIPAFLLIYPLWRRDGRWLAGCAVGLVIGLVLIPVAILGPSLTMTRYRKLGEVLVLPAFGMGEDRTRAKELIDITSTDSQSFAAILHNTLHFQRATRPAQATVLVRRSHWAIGGLLTLLTLLAGWRRSVVDHPATARLRLYHPMGDSESPPLSKRKSGEGTAQALVLGALCLLMILCSPVCHLHYFCMVIPILMALIASIWESRQTGIETPRLGKRLGLVLCLYFAANTLPRLPGLEALRDLGLAMYAATFLWGVACVRVTWPQRVHVETVSALSTRRAIAA
jgi:hypothetical protein